MVDGGLPGESAEERVAREHREAANRQEGGYDRRVSDVSFHCNSVAHDVEVGFVAVRRSNGRRWIRVWQRWQAPGISFEAQAGREWRSSVPQESQEGERRRQEKGTSPIPFDRPRLRTCIFPRPSSSIQSSLCRTRGSVRRGRTTSQGWRRRRRLRTRSSRTSSAGSVRWKSSLGSLMPVIAALSAWYRERTDEGIDDIDQAPELADCKSYPPVTAVPY
jgi:hypothetical protein